MPAKPHGRRSGVPVLLGVDGGGSKTRALIADVTGRVLGRGDAGASNASVVGRKGAFLALETAVRAAWTDAGRRGAPRVAAACFGMAGVDGADEARPLARWIGRAKIAAAYQIVSDGELLLAAGVSQQNGAGEAPGLALISGTGSICWGRAPDGRTARAGGWGPLIGDEGSGYALSLAALRLCAQTADGRADAVALESAVLARLGLGRSSQLNEWVHGRRGARAEVADVAPVVFALAATGDAHARTLIDGAASELARAVRAVVTTLGMDRPPLVFGGSLLRRQESLRDAVLAHLGGLVGAATVVDEPALGAIALAGRLWGALPRGG